MPKFSSQSSCHCHNIAFAGRDLIALTFVSSVEMSLVGRMDITRCNAMAYRVSNCC
jgi:hypothetical protein